MSTPKFILTADDYGPVDFINDGIIEHVINGTINSVQVLSNFDQDLLNKNMKLLWKVVPQGKTVDIGIHLTLASGSPLIMERDGKGTKEIWGKFVTWKKYFNRKGDEVEGYVFTKYSDFYLEYELLDDEPKKIIETTIIQEFKAQKARLEKTLSITAQHNPNKPNALKLTSVSNHYDFFTLSEKFFKLYRDIALPNLAIRSPRRVTLGKSKLYITALALLGVGNGKQRTTARKYIKLFDEYKYIEFIAVKTASYIDIGLYASFGGLSEVPLFTGYKSRCRKLRKIMRRINKDQVWENHPTGNKIVEVVFHLGKTPIQDPDFSIEDEEGYVGINYKYYDNRLIETKVLHDIAQTNEFEKIVLRNLASWEECSDLEFKKE